MKKYSNFKKHSRYQQYSGMTTPTFCMELVTWETDEILCLSHNLHSVAVKNPAMPDNGLGMTSLNFKIAKQYLLYKWNTPHRPKLTH